MADWHLVFKTAVLVSLRGPLRKGINDDLEFSYFDNGFIGDLISYMKTNNINPLLYGSGGEGYITIVLSVFDGNKIREFIEREVGGGKEIEIRFV